MLSNLSFVVVTFSIIETSMCKQIDVNMRKLTFLLCVLLFCTSIFGQNNKKPEKTQIMTLGVFHFAYHNLDAVVTKKKDQISVLKDPYQSEIVNICKAIEDFKPTIIAIERSPNQYYKIDSLYSLYKLNKYTLGKDEIDQLAFRIGKQLNIPKIHCVNDWGRRYPNLNEIFNDPHRMAKFENHYFNSPDSIYRSTRYKPKVASIIDELMRCNNPNKIKESLSYYLMDSFKYEEKEGDFTGVDFETSRWFSRNLRIFRNIQRINITNNDRVLLIIGSGHLNLLNPFFDASKEFELVSPLSYLEKAKSIK